MSENHKDLTPALLRAKTIIHDYQTKTGSFAPSKTTQQRSRPGTRPSSAPARKTEPASADIARERMMQRGEDNHKHPHPHGKRYYND